MSTGYEWDESKRVANIEKHGVDFRDAVKIFDAPTIEAEDRRRDYGEVRIGAYGRIDDDILFVVYTWRNMNRRMMSARKAGRHERERYQDVFESPD
jgi:uncharacterized DUF497 family protein